MKHRTDWWFDDDAGPLVRSYAMTRGRTTTPEHRLDMLTLVATPRGAPRVRLSGPEYPAIVQLCRTPQSIAEVSAALRLPLAVTKILVGDLITEGNLVHQAPIPVETGAPDVTLLQAVLDGIHRL